MRYINVDGGSADKKMYRMRKHAGDFNRYTQIERNNGIQKRKVLRSIWAKTLERQPEADYT